MNSIGKYAFYGCSSLTNITIPNSVTSIGNYAFSECSSITSITIPKYVTSIGDNAFLGCSSLTNIIVDPNNSKYSNYEHDGVLYNKDITELIRFPGGKTNVTIPNSVTTIGNLHFENVHH